MGGNRFPFTNKRVGDLVVPELGKRVAFYDERTPGLMVQVYGSGVRTFFVYRRVHGVPERVKLGNFPAIGVERARGLAAQVNGGIAGGVGADDLRNRTKAKVVGGVTLGDFFEEWLSRYAKSHKTSWAADVRVFHKYLGHWEGKPLALILRRDVQGLHSSLGTENGKVQANRVLALLSSLFGKALDWEMFVGVNPCRGIKRYPEHSRERFLQADEMGAFFTALAEEKNLSARDFILMALLTGARKSKVTSMRWEDVNLVRAVWYQTATKNGTRQALPLVPDTVALLETRKAVAGGSPWVFPSRYGHGSKPLTQPRKALERVCGKAGLNDLHIHDLRRSLGSWLALEGHSLLMIGKVLNQKSLASTMVYARLNTDPIRQAMTAAVAAMRAAAGVSSG